jgi:Tfp pilus assembly protein PilF
VDLARGKPKVALNALRELVKERPDDAVLVTALGNAALRAGRQREADKAFEHALELDKDNPDALLGRARLAADAGDAEETERFLGRAKEAGVDPDRLQRVRGQLLVLQGMGLKAAKALQEVPRSARDADVWANIGRAYAQAEQDRRALRAFRKALQRDPQQVDAHLGLALLDRRSGVLSRARKHIRRAERAARKTGAGDVAQARILAYEASVDFEYGNYDKAKSKAREAVRLDERNAEARLVLTELALVRGGDPEKQLRKAVEGRAPPPEAVGRLAARLERGKEACQLAERYMKAAPDGYDARDVRRVLSRCR